MPVAPRQEIFDASPGSHYHDVALSANDHPNMAAGPRSESSFAQIAGHLQLADAETTNTSRAMAAGNASSFRSPSLSGATIADVLIHPGVGVNTDTRAHSVGELNGRPSTANAAVSLTPSQLEKLSEKNKFSNNERTAWHGIETKFRYADNSYVPTNHSVATWSDLNAFIDYLMENNKTHQRGGCLNFTLHDYLLLDKALPSEADIKAIQRRISSADNIKAVEIVLRGDPLDPPKVMKVTAENFEVEPATAQTALAPRADQRLAVLNALLREAQHLHKPYQSLEMALQEAISDQDSANDDITLGEVLSRAIPHFNGMLSEGEASYRVDARSGRTKIVNFTQALARSCERLALENGTVLSPFDTFIAQTRRSGPSIYSIGGGQTLTLLLLTIKAMDCGKLPLDARLEGDNRSSIDKRTGRPCNSAVAEIVEQNQRSSHLGKALSIAQKGQCLVYMRPDVQRMERLEPNPPKWLLFNVPTNALKDVFSTEMMAGLAKMPSAPVLVLSAKSFSDVDGKVDVPATGLYQTLRKTPNRLQNNMIVLGGYFAAPWLASGSPVHFVVAGKKQEAVDSFANLMPDNQNGIIKHDRTVGKDQLFGTAIMGALKNQAVYTFARQVVQAAFEQMGQFPEWTDDQHCSRLNAWAEPAANIAIEKAEKAVEQLTARQASVTQGGEDRGSLGLNAITDFKCADGVRVDSERCMVRPIEERFVRFVRGLRSILQYPISEQGNKLQALLSAEVVDSGKGFGSRNSRDGVIDQALRIVFDAQVKAGQCDAETFSAFRQTWTPKAWLAKTTEGRNGMLPVLAHLAQYERDVPELIDEAAQLYGQVDADLIELARRAD